MQKQIHRIAVNYNTVIVLRVMTSLIFIVAGINHLLKPDNIVTRIEQAKLGFLVTWTNLSILLVVMSGILMLLAGISLVIGFKTKLMALTLVFFLIPITLIIQVGQWSSIGPLFKNVAILGALLFFILNPSLKNKQS